MIYTVTFNPSLDYIVSVNNFKTGATNRTTEEIINPGGKGINVSIVLSNLGMESVALGFYAGFTGEKITKLLDESNVKDNFIKLNDGNSRINVKCRNFSDDGKVIDETEINGLGPKINNEALDKFYSQINTLKDGDVLILSGSKTPDLPNTIYKDIMQMLQNKNIKIIVDATKDLLVSALDCRPFLVKPNKHELEEIFKVEIRNEEIEKYAKKLQGLGAVNVLVSNGGEGSLLLDENGNVFKYDSSKGDVVNSVGAGDSMIAGFLYGYLETNKYEHAFKYAIAAGSASAFSENFASKNEVLNLYNKFE